MLGPRLFLNSTLNSPDRDEAMARAYASGAYSMKEIGDLFGVHYMTVSRAVRRLEERTLGSTARPA